MTQKDWEHYFKQMAAALLGTAPETVIIQYLDDSGRIISASTEVRVSPDHDGHISLAE